MPIGQGTENLEQLAQNAAPIRDYTEGPLLGAKTVGGAAASLPVYNQPTVTPSKNSMAGGFNQQADKKGTMPFVPISGGNGSNDKEGEEEPEGNTTKPIAAQPAVGGASATVPAPAMPIRRPGAIPGRRAPTIPDLPEATGNVQPSMGGTAPMGPYSPSSDPSAMPNPAFYLGSGGDADPAPMGGAAATVPPVAPTKPSTTMGGAAGTETPGGEYTGDNEMEGEVHPDPELGGTTGTDLGFGYDPTLRIHPDEFE
jgi:hypothetical protein